MNERGGITNIVLAILITVFTLLALMTPINLLIAQADTGLNDLQGTTRYAKDPVTGEVVEMDSSGLHDLTLTLLYGLGFIFLLGVIIYIILFGPNRQPQIPQSPYGGF